MSLLSTFIVNPELSVVCFRRDNCKNGPFFAVREFDIKVIRSRDKGRRGRGPSEQAIRASIRQAVLNMNLKSERASKSEIRQLKGHGILGKRAPSCSLLCAEDMCRLLEAFGKDSCVRDLRSALAKDRKSEDINKNNERNSLPKRKSVASLSPRSLQTFESNDKKLFPVNPSKRPKVVDLSNRPKKTLLECPILMNKSHPQDSQLELQPQFAIMSDSNGLDALYSALLAFSESTDPTNTTTPNSNSFSTSPAQAVSLLQDMEFSADNSPIYSLPSPISISPTTSPSTSPSREPWCFASPQSPSSPLSDPTPSQRSPSSLTSLSSPDNYMSSEEEPQLSPKGLCVPLLPSSPPPLSSSSPPSWNLSFSHPTVLRPRKKKIVKSRLAAEISSLSSDIIAKLIADQSK